MSYDVHDSLLGEDRFPVGRLGAQYERTFRILTYLLAAWCDNAENREPNDKRTYFEQNSKGLSIIAFDKLAVFSYRIWNELWQLKAGENGKKSLVTFPYPFMEIPGKHGRGLGLYDWHLDKRPGFLPEILMKMANDRTQKYLRFENMHNKKINYSTENQATQGHRTLVTSGLEGTPLKYILKGMNEYEKNILYDLQNAIKRLSNHELRVLGTHSKREKTAQDVRLLFKMWRRYRDTIMNKEIAEPGGGLASLHEMVWHAEEMWRKSHDNRPVYKKACATVYKEISHADIKVVFQSAQSKEDEIWECEDMRSLRDLAIKAKEISDYCLEQVQESKELTPNVIGELNKARNL